MSEQRRQILEMLAEGKITADEAERLINAVEREQPESSLGIGARSKAKPKYLRVVLNSADGSGGQDRINVQVPLQLLRAGVRLTSLIPPRAITLANEELDKSGFPIDLNELKPQQLEELIDHLDEVIVDIDDADTSIRVFCE
ncbi:DUF2089 domain-containing protein [Glycomyces buryatensis]|uniref:DUF2089 domain-containing protein n=1 Tax=Glycomyces buryatensis TaxID=2570927 RepID=A0A4S8PT16_9ACTN|nr:DUF2089 domain-containing protein [Glycomyces buryatensis]THV33451.1 DUF2089 domain-containing protein [Glycomyces buryatensis]